MKRPKIFTWHVHGNYLLYLSQSHADFYIPYDKKRSAGYVGKTAHFPFPPNVHEIPLEGIQQTPFDVILFQDDTEYTKDQYKIFSRSQQNLPKIYLEHDPPRENPIQTKHIVNDPNILLIHVTHFNQLMWDNNVTPTCVIEHGVLLAQNVSYRGVLKKGIVVVNNIHSEKRGLRRMGYDIFLHVKKYIPLDIVGIGSQEIGGLGEISYEEFPHFLREYRFFFNPIRYTSLPLSLCEAMSVGLPIVGLSTTALPNVIENNYSGFVDTDIEKLISFMKKLLSDSTFATSLSTHAKKVAQEKFSLQRFVADWDNAFEYVLS